MIKYNAVQPEHASRAEMRAELAENRVSGNRALTGWACVAKYGEAGVDREAGRRWARKGKAYSTRQRTRGAHVPV